MTVQDLIDALTVLPSTSKMLPIVAMVNDGFGRRFDYVNVKPIETTHFTGPVVRLEIKIND